MRKGPLYLGFVIFAIAAQVRESPADDIYNAVSITLFLIAYAQHPEPKAKE